MVKQKYTSADTSINVVNRVYKEVPFPPNSIILDYGGGKYDTNTEYMAKKGVKILVYDPYNRSPTHNARVINYVKNNGVDYIVCSNVLNVIPEDTNMEQAIANIAKLAKKKSKVYFTVYEKNKSGIGQVTTQGYQRNQKTKYYLPFIEKYFKNVYMKKNIILAFN